MMSFRMKQNGARVDLNVVGAKPDNPVSGQQELWDGFTGGPSLQFVWAVPQDGINKPADFNASVSGYLRCIWNGSAPVPDPDQCVSAGTLTGPFGDGWYTATLTAATVPANAVMLTGGMGYSYNVTSSLPLTQTNLPAYPAAKSTVAGLNPLQPNVTGGLIVIAPNVQKVAAGFTGRRAIVEDKRCNACHQELGTFTEDAFHGGQRNDGTTCSWCHNPNRGSSGWTADSINFVHGIHGAQKRTVPYTWHSISTDDNFSKIVYPGVLRNCEQCHIPGSYDFANSASADAAGIGADGVNKRQFRYVYTTTGFSATDISLSPYVVANFIYGNQFSFNANTGVTTRAADTTLITSPTAAACVGCHDSTLAISHMEVNGGRFYDPRLEQFAAGSDTLSATPKIEQCLVCHASGRLADIKAVHAAK
jgi:OmcA/MtrC family decaheme c-type cytochrome